MTGRRRNAAPALAAAPRDDACLRYANTLSWRGSGAPVEALRRPGDLLAWIAREWPAGGAARGGWSRRHPAEAAALFAAAIALREAIYRIFSACACGDPVPERDLAALNRALAQAPARRRLARAGRGYVWRIGRLGRSAAALLAPVLWSAGDLMVKDHRLRCCANDECLWLFLDQSKGGTRRWCDMTSCGNRAKARRHYLKTKQG